MYDSNWTEIDSPAYAVGLNEALELAFFGQRVPIAKAVDENGYSRVFPWDEIAPESTARMERALLDGEIWAFVHKDGKNFRVPTAYWDTWHLAVLPEPRILMASDETYRDAQIFVDFDQIPAWKIIAGRLPIPLADGAMIECADAEKLLVHEAVPAEWLCRLNEFTASREKAVLWTWLEAVVWVIHRDLRQIGARALLDTWRKASGRQVDLPLIARIVASQAIGRDAEKRLLSEILADGVSTWGREVHHSRRERLSASDWDGGAVQFNSTVDLGPKSNKLEIWSYDIGIDRGSLLMAFPRFVKRGLSTSRRPASKAGRKVDTKKWAEFAAAFAVLLHSEEVNLSSDSKAYGDIANFLAKKVHGCLGVETIRPLLKRFRAWASDEPFDDGENDEPARWAEFGAGFAVLIAKGTLNETDERAMYSGAVEFLECRGCDALKSESAIQVIRRYMAWVKLGSFPGDSDYDLKSSADQ